MIELRLNLPSENDINLSRTTSANFRNTNNAPWKIHLLSLLQEVPKAIPIKYESTNNFSSTRLSNGTGSSSTSLCSSKKTNSTEVNSGQLGQVLDKRDPRRIESFRMEICDLSVSENLEKLCDHIFKLEASKLKARKLESISSHGQSGDISNFGSQDEVIDSNLSMTVGSLSTHDDFGSQDISIPGFGDVFHGLLNKSQTENLLKKDGEFLIRQIIQDEALILSLSFDSDIRNYRISCDVENELQVFYLEDRKKPYASLIELVQDGLTTLYLDMKAGFYVDIMTELANINKHDSCLSTVSISVSRKNSAITFSRQVSQIHQDRMSDGLTAYVGESFEKLIELELKQHCFVEMTPNKKSKCNWCHTGSLRPGINAFVCRDCGITIHESCVQKVDTSCEPKVSGILQIFGTDLTSLLKTLVKVSGKVTAPFILVKSIEEIENRGLESEGIYRVSGYQELILKLQDSFERDRDQADLKSCSDVNSICGLIKLYLRQLPEPLITKDVFDSFLNAEETLTLETVKKYTKMLPAAHKITLKYLLEHLYRVSENRQVNKMSPFNLSSVLAPSIIVPEEMSLNTLKLGTDVVEIMIKNIHTLFK